ncbi:MAG: hypothetical protein MUC51_19310 [Anaerolineae bacterium]|nr:hypothetical protein [Anaerolineae bacterium]
MEPDRVVRTTCPYCGVGCQIDLRVRDDRIIRVDAPFEAAPNSTRRSRPRRTMAGCASRGGSGWISSITPAG